MRRRDLFYSLSGYSLVVLAGNLQAQSNPQPSVEEIRRTFEQLTPPAGDRKLPSPEPNMTLVDLHCDVFVAGGGLAGVCAAISAAREGAKVVLVQAGARVGGS